MLLYKEWIKGRTTRIKDICFEAIPGFLPAMENSKGRNPTRTKLGAILFETMTNDLIVDWAKNRICADYTSALETIPRNSISLLNHVATEHETQ